MVGSQCICDARNFRVVFTYDTPPQGESPLLSLSKKEYYREVVCCVRCGHYMAKHSMDLSDLYNGAYANIVYGDPSRITAMYHKILGLPNAQSDNAGRVKRVLALADTHLPQQTDDAARTILDVGSGLCVFLSKMKEVGWDCTAVEPDAKFVAHARQTVGVAAEQADFLSWSSGGRRFDLVSFNKVLEHVEKPIAMLQGGGRVLSPGGIVYLEVPDGSAAEDAGPETEEFFVEHFHSFSPESVRVLVERAGLSLLFLERLVEPSGKFTIRACCG